MQGPFTWGANGQQISDEQRRMNVAQALLAGSQPIASPLQGVSNVANAYLANRPENPFPNAPGNFGNAFGLANMFRPQVRGGGLF